MKESVRIIDAKTNAIRIIHSEHRSIAAVLSGLGELARTVQDPAVRPNFAVLHAMIRYIDAFPERLHHPKEEEFLFAPIVRRAPIAGPLVATLSREHVKGARLIQELRQALLRLEINRSRGAPEFAKAIKAYAQFHWDHMRKEERELLPLAERFFTPDDWRALEAAFAANHDPLAGQREDDFDRLFSRIVNLAPAPIGLNDPWRREAPSNGC